MFLGTGDLKAYGGSKHGQVLRQIERDDWRGQSLVKNTASCNFKNS